MSDLCEYFQFVFSIKYELIRNETDRKGKWNEILTIFCPSKLYSNPSVVKHTGPNAILTMSIMWRRPFFNYPSTQHDEPVIPNARRGNPYVVDPTAQTNEFISYCIFLSQNPLRKIREINRYGNGFIAPATLNLNACIQFDRFDRTRG